MKIQHKEHYFWLDAIRFIAAFMVLLSHSRNTFFPAFGDLPSTQHNIFTMAITFLCRMGHEAVIIFFVLSGFLVGGRGFERIKCSSFNLKSYAIDRFSRIYPPLVMAIVFYFITCIIIPSNSFSWLVALGNLFNLQGIYCDSLISTFWSLSYEVWFYIVLGTLALAIMAKSNSVMYIGFCLFVASISVFVLGLSMHYLLIWLLGAVAYMIRPKTKNIYLMLGALLGFFITCVLWQLSKDSRSIEITITLMNKKFLEILMSLMVCVFIQQVILFEPKSKLSAVIEKKFGKMANFSYTLYLSHRIIFLWIIAFLWPKESCDFTVIGIMKYLAILVISLTGCWLLYLISEKHSPKIREFLKFKLL